MPICRSGTEDKHGDPVSKTETLGNDHISNMVDYTNKVKTGKGWRGRAWMKDSDAHAAGKPTGTDSDRGTMCACVYI